MKKPLLQNRSRSWLVSTRTAVILGCERLRLPRFFFPSLSLCLLLGAPHCGCFFRLPRLLRPVPGPCSLASRRTSAGIGNKSSRVPYILVCLDYRYRTVPDRRLHSMSPLFGSPPDRETVMPSCLPRFLVVENNTTRNTHTQNQKNN